MSFSTYIERVERLDQLIRLKATGSPKELAEKLKISERWLYECINELKALGAPIKFDKIRNTYIYTEEGTFETSFKKFKKNS